jgi:hypothetical protein
MTNTKCAETINGQHVIEWLNVPAQVWNEGATDPVVSYDDHQRGQCYACQLIFVR